jgi:catechol 2,3-dioxygenase-like lactoylglutathione lyase family enzyme
MKKRWMGVLARVYAFPLVLAPLIFAPPILTAQPPTADAGINGIAHIAFRVSDVDREIKFLGELGYEQSFAITNNGKVAEVFVKINDRQFIELYPQTNPPQPVGWMHVCYEVGDLNVLAKYYESVGLKLQPVRKAGAGNYISAINDPEGRVTELTQYLPGSKHMADKGQHLGANRVATELMGFDEPVHDGAADKEFYSDLGFEATIENGNVRLTAPAAPDLHIELRATHPGAQPQFLFPIADARRAEQQLSAAGANPVRDDKIVFVHDPDGNIFVFLELPHAH